MCYNIKATNKYKEVWLKKLKDYTLFTSESVTEGHPDKVSDQISDAVLDAVLAQDYGARVACEVLVTKDKAIIAGEITTTAKVDIENIAREVIKEIGYDASTGFDYAGVEVVNLLQKQSPDIAMGVDTGGAGDQGMMFGFACTETPDFMPASIYYSQNLARQLAKVRKDGTLPYLKPDGKCQVTVKYEGHKPIEITTVLISTHHAENVSQEDIKRDLTEHVIIPVLEPSGLLSENTIIYTNPTGKFTIGGPVGDTGLTGRKIIVDTYGGMGRHGGGAFSGKDPSKVDRSAAYMARYIAKNLVAAGTSERLEIEISYAIGIKEPLSVCVDTFSTGKISDADIVMLINKYFDLTPNGIIEHLDLKKPQYFKTAAYGHFGRTDLDVKWEKTDMVDTLKSEIEKIAKTI